MKKLCILLCCIMLLTACKQSGINNNSSKSSENYERVTNVYKNEKLNFPEGYSGGRVILYDGRMYFFCTKYNDDYTVSERIIYSTDFDGHNESTVIIEIDGTDYISLWTIAPDGRYMAVMNRMLYIIHADGSMELIADISAALGGDTDFRKLLVTEDNIYIGSYSNIYIFTSEGEFIQKIKNSQTKDLIQIGDEIYIQTDNSPEYNQKIQNDVKVAAKQNDVPSNVNPNVGSLRGGNNYSVYYGPGYDKYYSNYLGVYGWNENDEEATLLLNWQNSDIFDRAVTILAIISPDKIICSLTDYFDQTKRDMILMTRIPDEEVIPKITVTLALGREMPSLSVAAAYFNMTNDKYRIKILDYYSYNADMFDRKSYEQINLDIISGKIPDMILLEDDLLMPSSSYIQKGLFCDLSENYKDILLDIVYNTYKTGDKLYQVPIDFTLFTVAGKKSVGGDKPSMTIDEMLELNAKLSGAGPLFMNIEKEDLYWTFVSYALNYFVDFEKKTCNFQTDDFYRLFEFCKDQPDTYAKNSKISIMGFMTQYSKGVTINLPEDYRNILDNNKSYLMNMGIATPIDLIFLKHILGDDYILKGYPTKYGSGSAIFSKIRLAVTDKSNVKEGAIEFINFMLSEKIQNQINNIISGLPVTLDAIKTTLTREMYYYAEKTPLSSGNPSIYFIRCWEEKNEYEYFLQNHIEYTISEKEADDFVDLINSMQVQSLQHRNIYDIMREELAIYYAGDATIQKAADNIQRRVYLLINE